MTLPSFDKTLGETTYTIDDRIIWLAVLGAVVCLALLVALVRRAGKQPGALVAPLLPALSVAFVGGPFFFYVVRRLPLLWAGDARASTTVFHDAIALEGAAASIGVGAVVAVALLLALRTANQLRLLSLALPCAVLGTALATATLHANAITEVGSMPFYEVSGRRELHVGHERNVPVRLMRAPRRNWLFGTEGGTRPADDSTTAKWSHVDRVHVRGLAAGKVPFTADARRGPVRLTTQLHANAVPEIASPLLSLRVGDRSVYGVRSKSSNGAALFFITIGGRETLHKVTIDVVGTRDRDGFRTFVLDVGHDDHRREVEVVALAGETREYDATAGVVGKPIVASSPRVETSRPDLVPCSFALLDAPNAMCQLGGGAFAGAAPMTFQIDRSSTAGSIVTVFVAIVTIGLVIPPDGSSSSSYTLVSTERGPQGAAEAPSS